LDKRLGISRGSGGGNLEKSFRWFEAKQNSWGLENPRNGSWGLGNKKQPERGSENVLTLYNGIAPSVWITSN